MLAHELLRQESFVILVTHSEQNQGNGITCFMHFARECTSHSRRFYDSRTSRRRGFVDALVLAAVIPRPDSVR